MRCFSSAVLAAFAVVVALVACSSDPASSSGGTSGTGTSGGSSGTSGGSGADVETATKTFSFSGTTRKYIVSAPVDYDARKTYPLVMVLHGSPGTADVMLGAYPFDGVSKREAVIVYPNALGDDWDLYGASPNVDMDYLKAVVGEVGKGWSIDTKRVLGTGWSGGGFLVSQMACRMAGVFRAIAIHAGGAPDESQDPAAQKDADGFYTCAGGPLAVIVVHGQSDTTVEPGSGDYAGQHWAHVNGCGTAQADAAPSPCKDYDGCPAANPVRVCLVAGLGHPMWDQGHAASWAFFKSLP